MKIGRLIQTLSLLSVFVLLSGCGTGANARKAAKNECSYSVTAPSDASFTEIPPISDLVGDVIKYGRKFLGKPYRYKGPSPWPMDCSGYVSFIFSEAAGLKIPRSSRALASYVDKIKMPRPGDLVFFKGRNAASSRVGHVAVVVANDAKGVKIMHSTNSKGIIVEYLNRSAYFSKRFIKYGRLPEFTGKKSYPQGKGPVIEYPESDGKEDDRSVAIEFVPAQMLTALPLTTKVQSPIR